MAKAQGSDAIPAEVYIIGGSVFLQKLAEPFQTMSKQKCIPQGLENSSFVPIYKERGNKLFFDNHRGVLFFCIAVKYLATTLRNCLIQDMEAGHLSYRQCGFRKG
jgi:hypothetical protein